MEKVKPKKNRKKRLLLTVGILVLVVFLVVLPVTAVALYNGVFSERYETPAWVAFSPEDFPGLEMEECSFPSDDGQILAGYRYFKEGQEVKGVMVIAHGLGGGGQNNYMPVADYFTSNGYLVFAYDVTGNEKVKANPSRDFPRASSTWITRCGMWKARAFMRICLSFCLDTAGAATRWVMC